MTSEELVVEAGDVEVGQGTTAGDSDKKPNPSWVDLFAELAYGPCGQKVACIAVFKTEYIGGGDRVARGCCAGAGFL